MVSGVRLCTTSGVKSNLVRAFWMDWTGANDTLLDCGGQAPSSLSLAINCRSDALDTLIGFRAVLKVLSDSWTEGDESPMRSLCTCVHTRWLHLWPSVPAILTSATSRVPHGSGNNNFVFQQLQQQAGGERSKGVRRGNKQTADSCLQHRYHVPHFCSEQLQVVSCMQRPCSSCRCGRAAAGDGAPHGGARAAQCGLARCREARCGGAKLSSKSPKSASEFQHLQEQ